ncbi:MAG: branched-chain amino acid ABC transporter permease [Atribacterota bacterium]|nr:branched-chain amino acid ABC transporter permease [Atribacterota bacterium]MDD5637556.1 branched-chain amino acid ABC transporter permease [Atribacterota bacterium]
MFLQTIVTGIGIGSIYALMAMGYCLVFSILNFSNFAHGAVIMLGAYVGFLFSSVIGLPFVVSLIITAIITGILSIINERLAYRTLRERNAPSLYLIITAMGVSIMLENLVYSTIGSNFYSYPKFFSKNYYEVFSSTIGVIDVYSFFVSVICIILLHLYLNHSKSGIAIRAGVSDQIAVSLMGANFNVLIRNVFFLSGIFAGLAGVFMGMRYMVYPQMGWITNKAYIAAVIGGLGSLPGAVIGGLILGIIETVVSVYISSVVRDVFSFSLLILILLFKPLGLFGKKLEDKM